MKDLGWCNECNNWRQLSKDDPKYFLYHRLRGKKCPNSGYCPIEQKILLENEDDVIRMAIIISKDDNTCLDDVKGVGAHTLNCGDGEECDEIRHRRAKAIAEWVLTKIRT